MMNEPLRTLSARLTAAGLDLTASLHAAPATWNDWGANVADGATSVPGMVVGNTRALWAPFVAALRRDAALESSEDPLDTYIERSIRTAIAESGLGARARVWLASSGPPYVRVGAASVEAGLLHESPTGLLIHPRAGLWCALRALVTFDPDVAGDLSPRSDPQSPCTGCDAPCVAARRAAGPLPEPGAIARRPEPWIAIRDACPVGRGLRYGRGQIWYHYTGERRHLRED